MTHLCTTLLHRAGKPSNLKYRIICYCASIFFFQVFILIVTRRSLIKRRIYPMLSRFRRNLGIRVEKVFRFGLQEQVSNKSQLKNQLSMFVTPFHFNSFKISGISCRQNSQRLSDILNLILN